MQDIWIKEVEIINFQSHKQTKVNFVNGTNALIGSSNSGKTSVIRAIQWCLLNTPSGNGFIRVGENEAAVSVTLSNGKKIERKRDKKGNVNHYCLYDNGELVQEYTGFGNSIPPEIVEAHGIVPIASDVYFQFAHQLEAPFMLSLKPKKRAEVVGNLEELSRIDKALTETNDDIRLDKKRKKDFEKEEKFLRLEFERVKLETERLSGKVDSLKALKLGIESKTSLKIYLEKQLSRLSEIFQITVDVQNELAKANRITAAWPENLEERLTWFRNLQNQVNRLKVIKEELESISFMKEDKLKELTTIQSSIESKISQYQTLEKNSRMLKANHESTISIDGSWSEKTANIDYSKLDIEVDKFKLLYNHLDRLRNIEKNIIDTDTLVKEATNQIDKLLNEFVEELQKAEICPTCGQETHDVCTQHVEMIVN